MRELMRAILSANLTFTGIVLTIGAIVVFYGTTYLLLFTNLGKRLAFLVVGAALFGWLTINNLLFVLYAPRGPRPTDIEGLSAFEIRIIPLSAMLASFILFLMFVTALHRYQQALDREEA
jgi:hypothetical protein